MSQRWILGLASMVLSTSCSMTGQLTPNASAPATAAAACNLPVWWSTPAGPGLADEISVGFLKVPAGSVLDQHSLDAPVLSLNNAATYTSSHKWVRISKNWLSPDGTRLVYWVFDPSGEAIHVVDVVSGADRVAYRGATLYFPIAFETDAIYLSHAINPRQGSFENLYRLDPSGGVPRLVLGSDRHMYQWAWSLIADGAAWGVDYSVDAATRYTYSLLRLDLSTDQVSTWLVSPTDDLVWPMGVDAKHRLYVGGQNQQLWRVDSPGKAAELPDPGPVLVNFGTGVDTGFVSGPEGAWFPGTGGVWNYSDAGVARFFAAGPADGTTNPAGTCLS